MRLTLDLDGGYFQLQDCILKMLDMGLGVPDVIRPSSRRRGYHVIKYNAGTEEEVLFYRIALGDDVKRIGFDCQRLKKPKQILYNRKVLICKKKLEKRLKRLVSST